MSRRIKNFESLVAEASAPGYFNTLNVLTFPTPSGKQDVFDFTESAKIIGPLVGELGAAFARVYAASARYTKKANISHLRAYFRYHADQYNGKSYSVADIDEAYLLKYVGWLRSRPSLKPTTLDERFRTLTRLLEDIYARTGSEIRLPRNQFPHSARSKDPKQPLRPSEMDTLIQGSKAAVRRIWADFVASRDATDSELMLVRKVAIENGGLLPVSSDDAFKPLAALLKKYSRVEGAYRVTTERWRHSLYATSHSLIPFLILIMYDLAGNSEPIVEIARDCLSPAPDVPILAGLTRVEWSKARSGSRQYQYRGTREFSAPTLIKQVLEMTDPLVPFVPTHLRNKLFLYCSEGVFKQRRCHALGQMRATQRLKDFGRSVGLRPESGAKINLRFDMIRPTRLTVEYLKSGSIFRVNRLANHKFLTTSARYIKNSVTAERDAIVIANLQSRVLSIHRRPEASAGGDSTKQVDTSNGKTRAYSCKDPYRKSMERCPQWLKALLDDSLIVPDEPYYIARVIQAHEHLREAQLEVNPDRFAAIYLDALTVTEDILSHFAQERIAQAREVLPTLSAMPRIT